MTGQVRLNPCEDSNTSRQIFTGWFGVVGDVGSPCHYPPRRIVSEGRPGFKDGLTEYLCPIKGVLQGVVWAYIAMAYKVMMSIWPLLMVMAQKGYGLHS